MNEQTHFFIKNIFLTLYSRKGDVSCVWEMSWKRGQTAILTPSSSDHSSTSFSSCLGLLNHGSLRAQSPLSAASSHFGILSPTDCFSKSPNSQPIASGHDILHTPAPFPIWGLLWQLWLSYPLRASVDCTQCLCTWTKSRIVQSPTKLNDIINEKWFI